MHFDRATKKDVYLEIDVDIVSDDYPADGDDQIAQNLVTRGSALGMGRDVIAELLKPQVWVVSGVYDITGFRLGFTESPTGTANLGIDDHEISRFDVENVVVTTHPVTPS